MPRGQKIKPHRKALILLDLARGCSDKDIVKRHGLARQTVEKIKAEPNFRESVDKARWQFLESSHHDLLVVHKKAIDSVEELIDSEDLEIRLKASQIAINAYHKFVNSTLTLEAWAKLRDTDKVEQNNVFKALTPEQFKTLMQSGAAIRNMDLTKVPVDTVKLIMQEITFVKPQNGAGANGINEANRTISGANTT